MGEIGTTTSWNRCFKIFSTQQQSSFDIACKTERTRPSMEIMKSAGWNSTTTFETFYHKSMDCTPNFGQTILGGDSSVQDVTHVSCDSVVT